MLITTGPTYIQSFRQNRSFKTFFQEDLTLKKCKDIKSNMADMVNPYL